MGYNEQLAERIREQLRDVKNVQEQKMFRGITFLVNEKMCVCVSGQNLMCRVDPALQGQLLQKKGCVPVIMRGLEYQGYVLVSEEALHNQEELQYWVKLCLDFNPYARSSKKNKRSADQRGL